MLLLVSAVSSPEWAKREQLFTHARTKASFDTPQGRGLFSLIPLGICLGIPAALGLIPANIMVLLGALVACMVGRTFLSQSGSTRPGMLSGAPELSGWTPAHGWFLALAWSILALPLHVNSFDLVDALAAQTALGPAPLYFGPAGSAALWVALLAGLVAAAGWSEGLPRLARPVSPANDAVDSIMRWGESALAATAVAAVIWGPSLGALAAGPIDGGALAMAGISFLVTVAAVGAVSFCRRFLGQAAQWSYAAGAGGLALMAMMIAAFVR